MRPVPKQSNHLSTTVVLAAILGLTFVLRMKFWNQPFQMDEGVYGYIGWRMLDGLVPYKDVFDHKPPGIYLLYSLVFLLSEPSALNVKVFATLYTLGTALAVFVLAREVAGTRAGYLAALLFAIFSCGPKIEGGGVNTEIFMILPYTLGAYWLLKAAETDRWSDYLLTGLLIGLACTIKQVAMVNFLWVGGFFIYRMWQHKSWNAAVRVGADGSAILAGALIPWLPIFLYFSMHDALKPFFYWQVGFNFDYMERGLKYLPNLTIFFRSAKIILSENGFLWVLAGTGIWYLRRHPSDPGLIHTDPEPQPFVQRYVFLLLATWPIFSFLGIGLGGRYYGHYFIQIIPSLAVLGGIGLKGVMQEVRSQGRNVIRPPSKMIMAVLLIFSLYLFVRTDAPYYLRYNADQISFRMYGTPLFSVSRFVGQYLRERTRPDDLIYVWRTNPEINFYALRKSPSPFLIHWSYEDETLEKAINALRQAPPRYIVAMQEMSRFPALKKYVNQHYQREKGMELDKLKQIFAFEVYYRKEG